MVKISDVLREADAEGNNREARSFELLISLIDSEQPDFQEIIGQAPNISVLLRLVHKVGFWAGANYSKDIYDKLSDVELEDDTEGVSDTKGVSDIDSE